MYTTQKNDEIEGNLPKLEIERGLLELEDFDSTYFWHQRGI